MRAPANRSAPLRGSRLPSVLSLRPQLADGSATTLLRRGVPARRRRACAWRGWRGPSRSCAGAGASGVAHAIVGGFFVRPHNTPLGELRIAGEPVEHVPFAAPWGAQRACVHVGPGGVRSRAAPISPRRRAGDLLQAGPLLVRDGASVVPTRDDEGFSAGAHQFDSDISDGRHPRCALALTGDAAARGRVRRPARRRGRAHARRAGGRARRAGRAHGAQPRRRRLGVAGLSRRAGQPAARAARDRAAGGRPIATALVLSAARLSRRPAILRRLLPDALRVVLRNALLPARGFCVRHASPCQGPRRAGLRRHGRRRLPPRPRRAQRRAPLLRAASTCTRSTSPRRWARPIRWPSPRPPGSAPLQPSFEDRPGAARPRLRVARRRRLRAPGRGLGARAGRRRRGARPTCCTCTT